jgi:hypothetical protein
VAVRLVVLRALGLGDLLTAVPALRALARAFPAHERVLLAPAALAPVVDLLDDASYALRDVDGVRALPPALPPIGRGADVAVNLHGRGPQSTALLRAARPRALVAFGEQADWRDGEHETARWCRLLEAAGIAADPADLDLAPPPESSPHAGATVIHPGASAPATPGPPSSPATCARWRRWSRAPRASCAPTPAWRIWPRRWARHRLSSSGRPLPRIGGRRPSARAIACFGPAAAATPTATAPIRAS